MKYLKYINESSKKVNYEELFYKKVEDISNIVYSYIEDNLSFNIKYDLHDLFVNLIDKGIEIKLSDYIWRIVDNINKYIYFNESKDLINYNFFTDYDTSGYYSYYTSLNRLIDEYNINGEVLYYNIGIYVYSTHIDLETEDIKKETEYIIKYLEKIGFSCKITHYDNSFKLFIQYKLNDISLPKNLDLSDLVPDKITTKFEDFIFRKNLKRKDAEDIVDIFKDYLP